mmetsp:Transcript_26122/g.64900  ORF Transcript_26122/g.64900 Transcript_26122/m.64900 type:complete len:130 (-) Transcript_26122:1153-1542(-)
MHSTNQPATSAAKSPNHHRHSYITHAIFSCTLLSLFSGDRDLDRPSPGDTTGSSSAGLASHPPPSGRGPALTRATDTGESSIPENIEWNVSSLSVDRRSSTAALTNAKLLSPGWDLVLALPSIGGAGAP